MVELFTIMDSGTLTPAIVLWHSSWLNFGPSELKNQRRFQAVARKGWPRWERISHIALPEAGSVWPLWETTRVHGPRDKTTEHI